MALNKSGFTLTSRKKKKEKKEGRLLSGLTAKTSGSIVLVYIVAPQMTNRFTKWVAYIWQETVVGEVTPARLTRSSMWDMLVLTRLAPQPGPSAAC